MVRLVLSWNIKTEEETAYFEFVTQELLPAMLRLGLHPVEAWVTVYGSGPQIIAPAEASDRATLDAILQGDEWAALREKLDRFVTDFRQRVVERR
ncbi:MAG: hypothetical protein K1X39_10265 [Thermoflexales bacterium]|nr:hypothetical protein [Thermoflexales bacterium]